MNRINELIADYEAADERGRVTILSTAARQARSYRQRQPAPLQLVGSAALDSGLDLIGSGSGNLNTPTVISSAVQV